MLQYYRPRLDVSQLSDEDFIKEMGWLVKLRQMEREDGIDKVLKQFSSEQQHA